MKLDTIEKVINYALDHLSFPEPTTKAINVPSNNCRKSSIAFFSGATINSIRAPSTLTLEMDAGNNHVLCSVVFSVNSLGDAFAVVIRGPSGLYSGIHPIDLVPYLSTILGYVLGKEEADRVTREAINAVKDQSPRKILLTLPPGDLS